MKIYKYAIAALSAAALLCSCGNPAEEEGDITPQGPYTIVVDKATIEANGVDVATFKVLDANGIDITATNEAKYVYIKEVETNNTFGRMVFTTTALKNGTTAYYATYQGKSTENQVEVTAVNRGKYEKYLHKICIYDATGAWCVNCPGMASRLESLQHSSAWGENVIVLAVHCDDSYVVGSLGTDFCNAMGIAAWPSCSFDLCHTTGNIAVSDMIDILEDQMINKPSTCGVKIISSELENGTLTVQAAVKADKAGVYDLGCTILYDNLPASEGDYVGEDGMFHDTVVAAEPNFYQMRDTKVTLAADEEHIRTITFENFPMTQVENMRVVAYALSEDAEGEVYTNNATVCPLGEGIDYQLNE